MSKSIKTTGDLRNYLASIMVSVGNGTCAPEKAREIVKVAGQINESFYSEVKVQRLKMDLKQESDSFGEMTIGNQ
jgi:hypothetical protein